MVASWASAGSPENARSADSNTISRIRFFNAILLFLVRVWPARLFRRAPGRVRARHKFRRAPLGPRVVRLRETHALVERRMIVEPNLYGGRRLRVPEIHFPEELKCVRRHHRSVRNQTVDHFKPILIGLMLEPPAISV